MLQPQSGLHLWADLQKETNPVNGTWAMARFNASPQSKGVEYGLRGDAIMVN